MTRIDQAQRLSLPSLLLLISRVDGEYGCSLTGAKYRRYLHALLARLVGYDFPIDVRLEVRSSNVSEG